MDIKRFKLLREKWPSSQWRDRTYILPTRFGILYGSAVFLMIIMGLSYANNLVFLVSFFLASFGLVAMYLTNRNVHELQLQNIMVEPFFLDEVGFLKLELISKRQNLYQIKISHGQESTVISEVKANRNSSIKIPLHFSNRGWNSLQSLNISSEFPYQMCRSWKKRPSPPKVLVFPARKGFLPFPLHRGNEGSRPSAPAYQQDQIFKGHDQYQSFHSYRHIDWKASARHSTTLLIKKFEEESQEKKIFTWEDTQTLHTIEDRISQLTKWIDSAEKKKMQYQLILPDWRSSLSWGPQHYLLCLQTLALWNPLDVSH